MTPSIVDVVESGTCVGCGACSVATSGIIPLRLTRLGTFEPTLAGAGETDLAIGSRVCPFADESPDEDALASDVLRAAPDHDGRIGHYLSLHAGRIRDGDAIRESSSGGLTTWLLGKLLDSGEVDGVVHVGPSSDQLFAYTVSHSISELSNKRKSVYYATNVAGVLPAIRGNGRRYAFVGVPCFITATRLIARQDAVIAAQLRFFVGLVCGHLKSTAYAESLAWQQGVAPRDLGAVDFRVKEPGRPSSHYSFASRPRGSNVWTTTRNQELLGTNWGHTLFQLKACDFCDDIFAETADVTFGDAWLPEFVGDWRGTNILVNRDSTIERLLRDHHDEIELFRLSVHDVCESQAGNFRHRREGLGVRLADDQMQGLWIPRKRVAAGYGELPNDRIALVRWRRQLAQASHALFSAAKDDGDLQGYLRAMRARVRVYDRLTRGRLSRRVVRRFKREVSGCVERLLGACTRTWRR